MFNIREGLDKTSDTLPKRITHQILEEGPQKGQRIKPEDLALMLKEYYRIRNWDSEGRPTADCLEKYGLKDGLRFDIKEQLIAVESEDEQA